MKKNKLIVNTVRFFRKMVGITPEMLDEKHAIKRQASLIIEYLKDNRKNPKLQIGCQNHPIAGWLNVDIKPRSVNVVFMDATKKFPLANETFNYVFTEHMIEHIPFQDARFMVAECFRVIKSNGRIRISTPNLSFLIDLYKKDKTELQRSYLDFSTARYLQNQTPSDDVYVINNFVRDWGHQFIHDIKSLSFLLSSAGFVDIKMCHPSESEDIELQNLEKHGKEITKEFNELESIIVEARKP